MKFSIILPAIGLVMFALSACTDPGGGEGAPAEGITEQPAAPPPAQ